MRQKKTAAQLDAEIAEELKLGPLKQRFPVGGRVKVVGVGSYLGHVGKVTGYDAGAEYDEPLVKVRFLTPVKVGSLEVPHGQFYAEEIEVLEAVSSPPSHSRKKSSGGPSKKTKTIDGYKVTIWDHKTLGAARFAAYYDVLPASVVGRGETEATAIADLKRAADDYGRRRQVEIEREDWAEHEAEKERALRRGDY